MDCHYKQWYSARLHSFLLTYLSGCRFGHPDRALSPSAIIRLALRINVSAGSYAVG